MRLKILKFLCKSTLKVIWTSWILLKSKKLNCKKNVNSHQFLIHPLLDFLKKRLVSNFLTPTLYLIHTIQWIYQQKFKDKKHFLVPFNLVINAEKRTGSLEWTLNWLFMVSIFHVNFLDEAYNIFKD